MHSGNAHSKSFIVGIHGGGNIGLGVLGPVFSETSPTIRPNKIIFTSSDPLVSAMVETGRYQLKHAEDKSMSIVEGAFEATGSRDQKSVSHLYVNSSFVTIATMEQAFQVPNQTKPTDTSLQIAKALIERHQKNKDPLKIVVVMNGIKQNEMVHKKIVEAINALGENPNEILKNITFVRSIVDRIVSPISHRDILNELLQNFIQSEKNDEITIIQESIKTMLKELELNKPKEAIFTTKRMTDLKEACKKYKITCALYEAEKNFLLDVGQAAKNELKHFPSAKIPGDENFEQIEWIKNKFMNGPHAIMAWLGGLKGHKTISESIKDPQIRKHIDHMMTKQIMPALLKKFPNVTQKQLNYFHETLISRCEQNVKDTVVRVAADPKRKLKPDERVIGIIKVLKETKADSSEYNLLTKGAAAGILFAVRGVDPQNAEGKAIKHEYEAKGMESAIKSAGIEDTMVPHILQEIRALNDEYPVKIKDSQQTLFSHKSRDEKEKTSDVNFKSKL